MMNYTSANASSASEQLMLRHWLATEHRLLLTAVSQRLVCCGTQRLVCLLWHTMPWMRIHIYSCVSAEGACPLITR